MQFPVSHFKPGRFGIKILIQTNIHQIRDCSCYTIVLSWTGHPFRIVCCLPTTLARNNYKAHFKWLGSSVVAVEPVHIISSFCIHCGAMEPLTVILAPNKPVSYSLLHGVLASIVGKNNKKAGQSLQSFYCYAIWTFSQDLLYTKE